MLLPFSILYENSLLFSVVFKCCWVTFCDLKNLLACPSFLVFFPRPPLSIRIDDYSPLVHKTVSILTKLKL